MGIIKCKMCGGDVELAPDKTFGTCDYCGSTMTFPKVDDDQRAAAFNRGNHFRRIGEFDKALAVYERIVTEDDSDAEAHWCCALCRFGIEYVEDPATYEYIPTCHRASFDSILEDVDYLAALEHSDGITHRQYQKDAAKIAEVQRGVLAASQNEKPYDVFICYKDTDDTTKERTRDSIDAQEIYYQLTEKGYRVFFSRITLEDKGGAEYEPYIFAALNSAKVMIAVGSKPEYFNAVWVKNEWSRFIALMRKDRSKLLLPCYKDMDPYDLPEQLSVLQSYDMTKIGFMQDLIRGIKKVMDAGKKPEPAKETVIVQQAASDSTNIAPLIRRAFMFLEDGEWQSADEYCEKVLDLEPEYAQAYVGKLMAELRVHKQGDLANCEQPFDDSNNYQKSVRFGDDTLSAALRGYIDHINKRNEIARLNGIYTNAVSVMNSASTESDYKAAAAIFKTIPGFRDADVLAEQCHEKAKEAKKKALSVVHALMEGIKAPNAPTVEERLAETKIEIGHLEEIVRIFDSTQVQIKALQKALRSTISREKQLFEQQSRLGIFAGKEKKRIEKELAEISAKKDSLTSQIEQQKQSIRRYGYAADVDRDLKMAKKYADELEAQIEEAHANAGKEFSFEDALSIYMSEPSIAAIVNSIAPVAQYIPALYGKTDIIKFGRYIQKKNGLPEPIEWLVLTRENGRMLLISKYALDCQEYNTLPSNVTWETCTLRRWINGPFFHTAFSEEEKAMISSVALGTDKKSDSSSSSGSSTMDKVFLLSIAEANQYFRYFGSDRSGKCVPTAYAIAAGAEVSELYRVDGRATCWWWLRSTGDYFDYAASVECDGSVFSVGIKVNNNDVAVRPALWMILGS